MWVPTIETQFIIVITNKCTTTFHKIIPRRKNSRIAKHYYDNSWKNISFRDNTLGEQIVQGQTPGGQTPERQLS